MCVVCMCIVQYMCDIACDVYVEYVALYVWCICVYGVCLWLHVYCVR